MRLDDICHNQLLMNAERKWAFRQEAARLQRPSRFCAAKMSTTVGPAAIVARKP
jgi:hypothetical protein